MLGVFGDAHDREHLAPSERRLRVGQGVRANRHLDRLVGVQGLNEISTELSVILIDDRDRDVAQQLAQIGLRIKQAIDERREHDQAEDAAIIEDATKFGEHCIPDAVTRKGVLGRRRLGDGARRGQSAQPLPAKREEHHRQRAQDHERLDGVRCRQSANRLVEQNLDVPAQRQQGAPELRETVHRQDWEADAGKAEGRIAHEGGEAHPERQIAGEQLEQTAERKIGEQQKTRRGPHQQRVAAKRNVEEAMDYAGVHDHHEDEDGE